MEDWADLSQTIPVNSLRIGTWLQSAGLIALLSAGWPGVTLQAQQGNLASANPSPLPRSFVFEGVPNPPFVQDAPPAPMVDPALQLAEEELRAEEDFGLRMKFFTAIAENDKATLVRLLNAGVDPNMELPHPVPEDFQKRFNESRIRYYVAKDKGVTGLMLAASLGNHAFVKFLLMAGAEPMKMTKRHKTCALWMAAQYRNIEIMRSLMGVTPDHESNRFRITVDISRQQAYLWQDGKIEFETRISSGRKSHPTPKGQFVVTDKYRKWTSTLYDSPMPFFMRLSCGDFGLHVGALPGYPASHGCIRLPEKSAKKLFASVPVGTVVEIE